jgi:hypothetical protein
VIWATRTSVHIDRAACAWLVRRFIDPEATFVFVEDPPMCQRMRCRSTCGEPSSLTMGRTARSRRCSSATTWPIRCCGTSPGSFTRRISETSDTTRRKQQVWTCYFAGSLWCGDEEVLAISRPLFDGLYEYRSRATRLGREPS